jgi:hypothetical protein
MSTITEDGRSDLKFSLNDAKGYKTFGILMIGEGLTTAFPCFYISDGSDTFYFWPTASSGVLRFGTTEPTVAARASAGGLVSG